MTASSKTMDQKMAAAEAKRKKRMKKKPTTMAGETWHRFKKNKLAYIGMWYLIAMVVIAILAPVIAPYGMDDQNADAILLTPNADHWFGTDNFGRDILSRILYGSRISLMVGFATVAFSMTIGVVLGALAAYYQKLDNVMMRIVDIIGGIPQLLLAMAIAASLGSGLRNMMIAVIISTIPQYARITRSSVLTIKESEYVEAAKSIGASDGHIIFQHILPNVMSPIIVQSTLGVANAIMASATLSFMGLGIQPPSPEWGAMLAAGRIYLRDYPHMCIIPGVALLLISYALNVLGDGFRDAFDPRLKN